MQQPHRRPSLFLGERRQRGGGDLGGNDDCGLRHVATAAGQGHRAAAAILCIGERSDKAAHTQPIDDALDGSGVEKDQSAEGFCEQGPTSYNLAIAANWVCVKPSMIFAVKIEVCRCMATRIRNPI